MAATPPTLFGAASGLSTLFRTLGFALGPALAAALWSGAPDADAYRPAFIAITVLPLLAIIVIATIPGKPQTPTAAPPQSLESTQGP